MAFIDLPDRKKRIDSRPKDKDIQKAYNAYKPLRVAYLSAHPLCELCADPQTVNEDGTTESKVTAAEIVHHKKHILSGSTQADMIAIATDSDNLQALCKWHHLLVHGKAADPRFLV